MTYRILALIIVLWPGAALADAARDIEISAEALRSEDARVRVEAAERLSTLGRSELPAIDARLHWLKKRVVDPEEGYQALRRFAHAAGSRRADDTVDIEPGIKAKLEAERPSPIEAAVAEELLILRALEKIGSADAYRRAVLVFGLHFDVFRWESRHSARRVGIRAMPALLDAAAYGDAGLAEWATQSIEALGKPTPADALRALEGDDRAELLRAYAERRIMDAMESVAAFLDDPDPVVRKAAATALRRYGRNAIWQIRDMARIFLGEDLDRSWTAPQSLDYLIDKLEARRLAPQREALARATELAERGELDEARRLLDLVLAERPRMERRGVAADVYTKLAERATRESRHDEAALYLLKAALITPDAERRRELLESSTRSRAALTHAREGFHPNQLRPELRESEHPANPAPEPEEASDPAPLMAFALGALLLIGTGPLRLLGPFTRRALKSTSRLLSSGASSASAWLLQMARSMAKSMARPKEPKEPQKREPSPTTRAAPPPRRTPHPAQAVSSVPGPAKLPAEFVFGATEPKRRREL
jgi:hypothetical protein